MGENTHQNCTRQNKNKEDPGRQQPCWGFLFCTNLTQPTGNLDTASSIEIMELFSELHREGATVVVVTHEEDIASFTQRIIRFRDGQIISDEKNEAWKCREGRKTDAD